MSEISESDKKHNADLAAKHSKQGEYVGVIPIEKRGCTDILMFLLIIAMWVAMTIVGSKALKRGDPYRLISPIDNLGRVCGYEDATRDKPYFYTVTLLGLGTCIESCPTYDASLTSTDPSDYVCLSLPDVLPTSDSAKQLYISNFCMDQSTNTFDPMLNCGCNIIHNTEDVFHRCRFSNDTIGNLYTTQRGINYFETFIADILVSRYVIFAYGFVLSVVIAFIMCHLLTLECLSKIILWTCITGVLALLACFVGLAQHTAKEWEAEDPPLHTEKQVKALKAFSAILMAAAGLYFCLMVYLRKRINIAIKSISLAAKAIESMPIIVFSPLVQVAGFCAFLAPFLTYCFYLASDGEFVNVYSEDPITHTQIMVGKKYHLHDGVTERLWFMYFCLLWTMNFLTAMGSLVIALATVRWYFTPPDQRGTVNSLHVFRAYVVAVFYHAGTAAFGALIIALIELARTVAVYIQKNLPEKTRNQLWVKYVFCCINCCLACLERCMKFISKNAYIQTAIHSTSFMISAKNAFFTIARNVLTIGVVNAIADLGLFVTKVFVCMLTTATTYYYLDREYQRKMHDLVAPTMLVMLLSWVTVTMFMDVFHMIIDSILMCYITDLEQNDGKYAAFADDHTKHFIDRHQKDKKDQQGQQGPNEANATDKAPNEAKAAHKGCCGSCGSCGSCCCCCCCCCGGHHAKDNVTDKNVEMKASNNYATVSTNDAEPNNV